LALGLNYKPKENIMIRPEVRWDWIDINNPTPGVGPFGRRDERSQFMAAVDLVLLF
jgi:hypothetical protein